MRCHILNLHLKRLVRLLKITCKSKTGTEMENKGLNKVDLIFEKINPKEVLQKAFNMTSTEIIQDMLDSGLKGRGGAGFPTGLKWKYTAAEKSQDKYII